MDLNFNFCNTHLKEFAVRRADLIIDLSKWISIKMNYIHSVDHDYIFCLRILRNHLKISVNKKHLFEQIGYNAPRYLVDVNAFGVPEQKSVWYITLSYLAKSFMVDGAISAWEKILKNEHSICLGLRGKELEQDKKGVYVEEVYPYLLWPNYFARKRWKELWEKEQNLFLRNVYSDNYT